MGLGCTAHVRLEAHKTSTISTVCDIFKQGVRKPKGMLTWHGG